MNEISALLVSSFQRAPWGWLLLATAVVGLIKAWPALAKLSIEARAQIRKEKREDRDDCQRRLDEMAKSLDQMKQDFTDLKIELAAALSAYRILEVEVAAVNPSSIGLAEARALLRAAFSIAPPPSSVQVEQ